jgi:pimeloyl-ACP methyl ester carboxylesterase
MLSYPHGMRFFLVLVVLVAACSAPKVSTPPPPVEAGDGCLAAGVGTPVHFGGDTTGYLAGRLFGTGHVGMVFGHESEGDACDWMPDAQRYATEGYTTLAIDFDGYHASTKTGNDLSGDIDAAVAYLATRGVATVVLVGSSMGGSSVLAAVPASPLPVAGVIALSPPAVYSGADAIGSVGRVTVPTLIGVGHYDEPFYQDAQALYRASASAHKKLVVSEVGSHGHALLTMPDIADAIGAFLRTYAPATG